MGLQQLAENSSNIRPEARHGATEECAAKRAESRFRLLIIDDEIRPDDPLVSVLKYEGVDVTTAQSGTVGLAYARAGGFDAIVLDLKLPDILGMTVLSFIRTERVPIPVIVMTGHFLGTDHEEKALQAGAAGFLTKPIFDGAALAVAIRQICAAYVPPSDPR